jgi:AcrR family transcriptional regulator
MNGDSVLQDGSGGGGPDPRARRRAARRAESREGILDAAERVFGEVGIHDGSLRQIADLAGFSTAAIYLFFENKQDLLTETLLRGGTELNDTIRAVAERDLLPLDQLHRIVDVTQTFFESRPHFRRLLRRIAGDSAIVGPSLAVHSGDVEGRLTEAMSMLAGVVEQGQEAGEIRAGEPYAIARLYAVLVNEHVHLAADGGARTGAVTPEEFHGMIDGLLRKPRADPSGGSAGRPRRGRPDS